MNMVEVPYPVTWVRDRVVLRVFDEQDHDIADLDANTGLGFVVREQDGKWLLGPDLSNVPDGRWVFDAVYVTGGEHEPMTYHTIHLEGVKKPGDLLPEVPTRARKRGTPKRTYDYEGSWMLFAPHKEREQRMATCRACPLYAHESGTCSIDGAFMAAKTKVAGEVCPDKRWGQASNYSDAELEARRSRAVGKPPTPLEGQDEFEAEWEARHASR